MNGWILKHAHLGIGKVVAHDGRTLRVRYVEGGAELTLGPTAIQEGVLVRVPLAPGARCTVEGSACTVHSLADGGGDGPFRYRVQREDGTTALVSEVDLAPFPGEVTTDPLLQLASADAHPYALFAAREWLVRSHSRLVRNAGGFQALLSSRIDLRPHQAYVAGVIVGDWRRRYILADEVGLGKTIEAGVVIHDLLLQKPDARILVICPGELTQQWLCEIFSKFGGHVFTLVDLHDPEAVRPGVLRKAIVSTALAGFRLSETLAAVPWDMVVVDEVHHLLQAPRLYALVERLSRSVKALLLLSALPAQRREDEFLRLLRLLEPDRYGSETADDFRALHAVQREVGLRLRRLSARAQELQAGEVSVGDVARVARRLLDVPALARDGRLLRAVDALAHQEATAAQAADEIVAYVADRYRVNRRILRNRRQHLIERGEIAAIQRHLEVHPYEPGQLEREAADSVVELVCTARSAGLAPEVVHALARVSLQSLVSPGAVSGLVGDLARAVPSGGTDEDAAYAASGHLAGYAEWPVYRQILARVARPFLDDAVVARALERARAWQASSQGAARIRHIAALLRARTADGAPPPKILLFAGFPGACTEVAAALGGAFGAAAVREFRHDLPRDVKEENVRAFATNPAVWVLVSDETGGEGRNFQFVDEVVHVDTPWSVARVEQRIGRLDRIGREAVRPEVLSRVIVAEGTTEAGLVQCYAEGIGVYGASVSGLEFALRDVERGIIEEALVGGYDGMCDRAPEIREALSQERARDEGETVLDEASFGRSSSERLRHVHHSARVEAELERSFVRYVRSVSSKRAARADDDRRHPEGVWTLHPDEFRHGVLPRAEDGQAEIFRKAHGTFRRAIAQVRPDLEFFTAGHPLFDAIVRSLGASVAGRTYAISCAASGRPSWTGFEFVFRAEPDWNAVASQPGLAARVAEPFTAPPVHLFCTTEGVVVEDGDALIRLRQGLQMPDQGRTWVDIQSARLLGILGGQMGSDWQGVLLGIHGAAHDRAREQLASRLEGSLAAEDAKTAESLRQIRMAGVPADSGEAEALECLRAARAQWSVVLDSVGFLAVNVGRA